MCTMCTSMNSWRPENVECPAVTLHIPSRQGLLNLEISSISPQQSSCLCLTQDGGCSSMPAMPGFFFFNVVAGYWNSVPCACTVSTPTKWAISLFLYCVVLMKHLWVRFKKTSCYVVIIYLINIPTVAITNTCWLLMLCHLRQMSHHWLTAAEISLPLYLWSQKNLSVPYTMYPWQFN